MDSCLITHSPLATIQLSISGEIQAIYTSLDDTISNLKNIAVICDSDTVREFLNNSGVKADLQLDNPLLAKWRKQRYQMLMEYSGSVGSYKEYRGKIRNLALERSSVGVRENAARGDEVVAQIIHAIDDLRKSVNLTANRFQELYSLHFPEMVNTITNITTLAKIVLDEPVRSKISAEILKSHGIPASKITHILNIAKTSLGGELSAETLVPIQDYASTLLHISEKLKSLENWIDTSMDSIAVNLTAVCGANVGARLIAAMGSLRALSMKSSSKIQILGAERALYSALRTRGLPPKHGLIFQIPEIGNSPYWIRGKIARAFAAKIVIAARLDVFDGPFLGAQMRVELREYEKKLRVKYPNPPPQKPKKPSGQRSKKFGGKKSKDHRHKKHGNKRRNKR